jgi:hypothetical protein
MFPPAFLVSNTDVGSKETFRLTIGAAVAAHPTPSGNTGVLTQTAAPGFLFPGETGRNERRQSPRCAGIVPAWTSTIYCLTPSGD